MLNIVFMGTPDFAGTCLKKLIDSKYNVKAVVTNPDRPSGRGMKTIYSPVKELALEKNIKVLQPERIKSNEEFVEEIRKIKPDVICVVAYGKIIPKEILDIPKYGCINVHGSILPKYRGAAPIQWAVLNGDERTGVTTMYMNEKMDEGDIIYRRSIKIDEDETLGELWKKLSKLGSMLLIRTLESIEQGKARGKKQGDNYTLAPLLSKEIAKISWYEKNSEQIKNLVRGLNPIMGAYSFINDKKIKFWKVKKLEEKELEEKLSCTKEETKRLKKVEPGTILMANEKKGLILKTIDGAIDVIEIQGENSKKMSAKEFLRGAKLRTGMIFE